MNVSCLTIFGAFEPSFDIDVAHLLPAEEGVVFENHLVCVPDDDAQLPRSWLSWGNVHLKSGEGHVHREQVHPHLHLALLDAWLVRVVK